MSSEEGVDDSITMPMPCKKMTNGLLNPTTDSRKEIFLPVEIITEILSWLPANTVLRFKCISKLWLSITNDPEFIHKHLMRVREYIWVFQDPKHLIRKFTHGLILELVDHMSSFRLRNPTTRRVLYLPDPNKKDSYYHMLHCYAPRTRAFKAMFPCPNGNKDGNGSLKILTIGVDDTWRTLDFPFCCKLTDARWLTRSFEGVYAVVVLPNSLPHGRPSIVFMEEESEKLWMIQVPQGLITSQSGVYLMCCGERDLALARRSEDGDELHVWVLEEQKWPEEKKIVIDLKSMKPEERYYTPCSWYNGRLWLHKNNDRYIYFDQEVTHIEDHHPISPGPKLSGEPSLVELKGMKPLA